MPESEIDIVELPDPKHPNIIRRVLDAVADNGKSIETDLTPAQSASVSEVGFPHTHSESGKRPIGSLYPRTVGTPELTDIIDRYQIGRIIITKPIDEAFFHDFKLYTNGEPMEQVDKKRYTQTMNLYKRDKTKLIRFFYLVRGYGHSELILGYKDEKGKWPEEVPKNTPFTYVQPVPYTNEIELKETDEIPINIQYLIATFGSETITMHPSRFLHAMNPAITSESKQGESVLTSLYNMLQTQIHADWAIGQALWRGAGGLIGLYAPNKLLTDAEKNAALNSVVNYNARTVLYIPFGWQIKDVMKRNANIAVARTYAVIMDQLSAGSGIPKSILLGTQRGALAPPEEDKQTWYRMVRAVQENMVTPVLHKYFRAAQEARMIPDGDIEIRWNELDVKSPMQRARDEFELIAIEQFKSRLNKIGQPTAACEKCGAPLEEGMTFCPKCGTEFETPVQTHMAEEVSTGDLLKIISQSLKSKR